jgi:hypothetical protein
MITLLIQELKIRLKVGITWASPGAGFLGYRVHAVVSHSVLNIEFLEAFLQVDAPYP